MFKNLLKLRHDAPAKELGGPPPQHYAYQSPQPPSNTPSYSVNPVEYDREVPKFRPVDSPCSVNPVEYRQSTFGAPAPPAPRAPPTSTFSINPVEYRQSPFGPGVPGAPVASSTQTPIPIDYRASAPMPTPRQAAQPKVVANYNTLNQQAPSPYPMRYTYTRDALPPASPAPPQELPSGDQAYSKFAYYAPTNDGTYRGQRPVELAASPVPPRYELPSGSVHRQNQAPPYSPPQYSRQSPNPGWTSPSGSSTTTLVPSPRTELHSPILGSGKPSAIPIGHENDGIKKFVVDIYCPLKRDANGNRRVQIPCDVREFRLAKVALIPIVAGKRTFVSFDVVFGEMDKIYSDLVEKHFSCSHHTRLTEVNPGTIQGGQVYTVGPLNIAYRDGESSTVYVKFPTEEDKSKFKAAFWDMWQYVEHTTD